MKKSFQKILITVAAAAVVALPSAHAAKKELKAWYPIGSSKALVHASVDRTLSAITFSDGQEMLIDRNGYRAQILRFKPKQAGQPLVVFIVYDLGYSDRSFVTPSGVDGRFETVVRNRKDFSSIGEAGRAKNKVGKLDFVHYSNTEDQQCLALRQYSGFDGSGDVLGDALGSTKVEGYFCAAGKSIDVSLREKWIHSFKTLD